MKTFRPGATLAPLTFVALMLAGVAYILFDRAAAMPDRRWLFIICGSACVLYGPVAAIVHFLRCIFVSVAVDPHKGLIINGRREVTWREVRSVTYYRGPFRKALDAEVPMDDLLHVPVQASPVGIGLGGLSFAAVIGITFLIFPVFVLLSPWQPKVIITLKGNEHNSVNGPQFVLRDLADADELVGLIQEGLSSRKA